MNDITPDPIIQPVDLSAKVPLEIPGKRVKYAVTDAEDGTEKTIKIGTFIVLAILLAALVYKGFFTEVSLDESKIIFISIGGLIGIFSNILDPKASKE